jgi:hypothetical protein
MFAVLRFIVSLVITFLYQTGQAQTGPAESDYQAAYAEYQQFYAKGNWYGALDYSTRIYAMGKTLFPNDSKRLAHVTYIYGVNLGKVW